MKPTKEQTANPENKIPMRTRAWEFWRRNQILLLQLPAMLVFLVGS